MKINTKVGLILIVLLISGCTTFDRAQEAKKDVGVGLIKLSHATVNDSVWYLFKGARVSAIDNVFGQDEELASLYNQMKLKLIELDAIKNVPLNKK